MTQQDSKALFHRNGFGLAVKTACAGVVLLMLQACSSVQMPEPKYPIYMQDKPAEATQTVAQAGDDRPVVAPPATTPAPRGNVETSELAPPPPPPPPTSANASSSSVSSSSASSSSAVAAPVKDMRAGYVYVLQAHDTLYGVSRRFGVPVKVLYDLNGLPADAALRIGQKILLPPSAVDKGMDAHASGPGMVKLAAALSPQPVTTPTAKPPAPAAATPARPVAAPPGTPPANSSSASSQTSASRSSTFDAPAPRPVTPAPPPPSNGFPTNAQLAQMGKGMFNWPLRGKILVPFGQLAPNVRNDGINISADTGADVRASADGVVVYQGNQVKELGNTVYIKHANGWYTGYSHLGSMNVQNNQHVTRGQTIGSAGQTGAVDRPQLHFEIRYTPSTDIAKPIDPTLVLP